MDRREALSLAALVSEAAPWAESIYALPVRPAEQRFPDGPYTVFLSSAYLCVEVASLQEWLDLLQQLQPDLGPSRLPLFEEHQFNAWGREQLARRGRDIHFERYHVDNKEERKEFAGALQYLLERVPLTCDVGTFLKRWRWLAEGCVGCIGILKDWLVDAVTATLAQGGTSLTENILT